MKELTASHYKTFSDGLQGNTTPSKARMEVNLPQKLLDKVDQKADNSEEYSSRSELVREALRKTVEGDLE